MRLFISGNPTEYTGKMEKGAIVSWIKQRISSTVEEVYNMEELNYLVDNLDHFFMYFPDQTEKEQSDAT
jgi:hypothetical protein